MALIFGGYRSVLHGIKLQIDTAIPILRFRFFAVDLTSALLRALC